MLFFLKIFKTIYVNYRAGHLSVMLSVGNHLANCIWESDTGGRRKPTPGSSREEKERWALSKYVTKEFISVFDSPINFQHHLIESVSRYVDVT